jgi:hypothetical protein
MTSESEDEKPLIFRKVAKICWFKYPLYDVQKTRIVVIAIGATFFSYLPERIPFELWPVGYIK